MVVSVQGRLSWRPPRGIEGHTLVNKNQLNAKRGHPDRVEAIHDGRRPGVEIDPQSRCTLSVATAPRGQPCPDTCQHQPRARYTRRISINPPREMHYNLFADLDFARAYRARNCRRQDTRCPIP
jgi:hypothetical protein